VEAVYGGTPTLDGTISAGEWIDASNITFTGPSGLCTVYVKQNGSHLHIAFNIPDNAVNSLDLAEIAICKNNDHASGPIADDFLLGKFRPILGEPSQNSEAKGQGGSWVPQTISGWSCLATHSISSWEVEFSIAYSKIGITAGVGKTLGIEFFVWNQTIDLYSWHSLGSNDNPSLWGDITSTDVLWVPWFTTPSIALFISSLFVVILKKEIHPHN
jgi:hypothetical protein